MHLSNIAKTGRQWYADRVSSAGQWVCGSVQNHDSDIRLCIPFPSLLLTSKVISESY